MRVIVIGAGIGGLALAQGLCSAGIEVAVHDRDPEVSATGGYRLHLDRHACAALRRRLPAPLFQALLGSSAGPQAWRRFGILDHRLRLLAAEPRAEDDEALLIGRVPLRRLLTHGLPELRFGAEFTHHETHADGRVTAHFADGSTDRGDLLVGADGVGSRVATALAGRPTSAPVGLSGIAGRTPLTDGVPVPDVLLAGPALAFSADGVAVFLSVHDPAAGAVVDPATCLRVPADVESGDIVWGVTALDERLPADVRGRDHAGLRAAALDVLGDWAPALRAIVAAESRTVAHFRFHAADPDSDLTPWPSGVVTALGDAVHAMPPTGGRAAATAVRDADLLAGRLVEVGSGATTIPLAVQDYESAMPGYARDAVRESLAPVRWIRRLARPGLRGLARAAFPVAAAAARVVAAR